MTDPINIVIAPTFQQAKHFAQNVQGWANLKWRYARESHHLMGILSIVLYDVRAPRYEMGPREAERMEAIQKQALVLEQVGRIVKRHVINLP